MYIIEAINDNYIGKIKEIVKSPLKNAIISKYVDCDYKDINLFNSFCRTIKQNIPSSDKIIYFDIQPPISATCLEKCLIISKDVDNKWWFNSKGIKSGTYKSITFEYYFNGAIYTLIYYIYKQSFVPLTVESTKFDGSLIFEELEDITLQYMIINPNIIFNNVFNSGYINNGIIKIKESGTYSISMVVNYKYNASVKTFKQPDAPFYTLNYYVNDDIGPEIARFNIPIVNYNKPVLKIYVPVSNGTVNINIVNEFDENDEVVLVYNLGSTIDKSYQVNVYYQPQMSYINLVRIV